jgi:RimJ/RimL family protein N-acetyltransferase
MDVFLETERLRLRRLTDSDVENLVELDSDPEVMRYTTGGKPTSRHAIETGFLPAFLVYYQRYEGFGFWAAVERTTGEFLGWFHFRPPEGAADDEVELGYRLRRVAWGKGYATEGSLALIRKGFTELGVQRVTAAADRLNYASRRVMEKIGMRLIRTFGFEEPWPHLASGPEQEGVEYELTRAQWEALEGGEAPPPSAAAEDQRLFPGLPRTS